MFLRKSADALKINVGVNDTLYSIMQKLCPGKPFTALADKRLGKLLASSQIGSGFFKPFDIRQSVKSNAACVDITI